ncbi:MAG: hypothetical protein ACREBC_15325, partial [Pyrinomonadaceae bacterium]
MKAVLKLIVAIVIWAWSFSAALAQTAVDEPLMLIRMPGEAALVNQPPDADIARFVTARGTYLHMTPQEL